MSVRNLLNSNMWQLVSPNADNEPYLIYNRYLPIPTNTQVGGVRPDNVTVFADQNGVITSLGNGTIGNAQFIPYLSFVSSPIASADQTFGSNLFAFYFGNANFATVSADGAILQPNVDYILSPTSITITAYLLPNTVIEVQAKVLPQAKPQENFISTESGNQLITESGDFITIQQVFN